MLGALDRSNRERKSLKSFEKCMNTWETQILKNSPYDFRSVENASIDPTPIEHRSKQTETHSKFKSQFRSIKKQVRSVEILEKSVFRKTKQNNVETPQSIEVYELHAWVWDEMLFKTQVLNPVFPKLRFSIHSLKRQICFTKNSRNFQTWLLNQRHTQ